MYGFNYKVKRYISLIFSVVALSIICTAQSEEEIRDIFLQAESYYLYEEYELANQLYILIDNPENMNIKYKIGSCYLNIPGEKEKSVTYLKEASGNIDPDCNTESYKETTAPVDIYFFLARAYMINNEFEKAIDILERFKSIIDENDEYSDMENVDYINQLIDACKNAIEFRKVPVSFSKEQLGNDIVEGAMNLNPAVSYDGNTLVYTEQMGIENIIFFTKKKNGEWLPAVEINSELNAGTDCSSCSLNKDGTELFLYKTDGYDGTIYSSRYIDGSWTPIEKLNKNINTRYFESHASISYDGSKLFFSSNRKGGEGNLDIYVSERNKKGDWGPAVNMGPVINTPFNEDTPFITQNDSILFFCSEGHNSIGGYDNFKANRSGAGWTVPSNLGYPVNSADDDKFFQPFNNDKNAYYSMTTDYKKKGIFYLTMSGEKFRREYAITGNVKLSDTTIFYDECKISIIDRVSLDTLYSITPDISTGEYTINIAPGLFHIDYSCPGFYTESIDTIIVKDNPFQTLEFETVLFKDSTTVYKPGVFEKIDLAVIPVVDTIDSSLLVRGINVADVKDKNVSDSEVLYYTVQVMALHKPVDVTYFKYVDDIKVIYNDDDKFYRYTTGKFMNKEDAYIYRDNLISKGYPDQIFVKKIFRRQ